MNKKLVSVERSLQVFNKESNDIILEEPLNISFEELQKIIAPKPDDPLLYGFYTINNKQVEKIISYTGEIIEVDFDLYYYVLACFGLYE